MFQPSATSFDTSARSMMDASLLATALVIASYRDPNPALYREHYGRSHRLAALPDAVRDALPANVLARFDAMNSDQRDSLADLAASAVLRLAA